MSDHRAEKAVFEAADVTKIYRTGEVTVEALRGVNLTIYEGEFVVLLGASGSGKSTLLNILGGLDRATSGRVTFRGQEITRLGNAELTEFRRFHVGFVALVTDISEDAMEPEEALSMVGLSERMDHFPSQLSGGEQQRVAIARAIVKRPDVLLCDEPTGALDVQTGKSVLRAIDRINREFGTTTAVITHNAVISRMAHRVIHISGGEIHEIRENEGRCSAEELDW